LILDAIVPTSTIISNKMRKVRHYPIIFANIIHQIQSV